MTKPSELDPYVSGQDFNFHGQRPGESVRISVDDLAPSGAIVNSKRDLEATGQYYRADGRFMPNANDPVLGSLYGLIDPLGVESPAIIQTFESKAVKVARGFQTMALHPTTNDVYYVDITDQLCKLTAASNHATPELVETGITGIAFTANRTFKCLSSNGDCVVINHSDSTERTIPFSLSSTFPGAYSLSDGFDYVAVGDKIWKIDDNSVTEYAQTTNVVLFFVKADDRLFFVPMNDEKLVFEITDVANFLFQTYGNEPISSCYAINDTIITFNPSDSQGASFISTYDAKYQNQYYEYHSRYGLDYLVPLTESAFILTYSETSGQTYNELFTMSRGGETEYNVPVNPYSVGSGAQSVLIGDKIFVAEGVYADNSGDIVSFVIQQPDPSIMKLPYIYNENASPFLRKG